MAPALILALLLASTNAAAAAKAAPAPEGDVPAGAPTDDYQFVAWCHGALTGHMALYNQVKPELDKVSPGGDDTAQMAAGKDYLALYEQALSATEKADPRALHQQGVDAETKGRRIWAPAQATDDRTRMWSWLLWELPGRCETAAKRLVSRADLFGVALRNDAASPGDAPPAAPAPAADPSPSLRGSQ